MRDLHAHAIDQTSLHSIVVVVVVVVVVVLLVMMLAHQKNKHRIISNLAHLFLGAMQL